MSALISPRTRRTKSSHQLQGIFDGLDTTTFKDVKDVIDKKDGARFEAVYRQSLAGCYSCRKSVGGVYLRPQIPAIAPQPIVNLNPAADWPK